MGRGTEIIVPRVFPGPASHEEVQAAANVVTGLGEAAEDLWMLMDARAKIASLRRLAGQPLHEALGTGLESQLNII